MKKIKFDYSNKVALVTGASSGIGREAAMDFASCGASVVVSDVNSDLGQQTAQIINDNGGKAVFYQCDVSQASEVNELIEQSLKKFGKLNVCCNNAGIEGQLAKSADCTIENWDSVIDTNLKGVWLSMKAQIPVLLDAGGGSIVNLSSIAGLIGFPGLPAYVASKHGIIGLTKTAALEYADKNIRINAVCPGPIMTPMLERIMSTAAGFKENLLAQVPEHRIGEPEDVAQSILFLSSDQAKYITGQSLAVDGGWVSQ